MDLIDSLTDRLLFAIPKKGRLYDKCVSLLKNADIAFNRSNRLDIALCTNLPIALVFLPAADIPTFVGEGKCDLGITGIDQVRESGVDVDVLMDLEFGKCNLQVQAPAKGSYTKPEQLIGKTVVSSFINLTSQYFSELEGTTTDKIKTTVKYVGGSVEAACALGVADAVVDLVESGETMRAAGLTAIATVLPTSAHLIASKHPNSDSSLINTVTGRITGVLTAQKYVYCTYNAIESHLPALLKITPGRRAPTISKLSESTWVAVSIMILRKDTGFIMDQLQKNHAEDIMIFEISNCRV
ncbi:HCL149Wp [Eremothecium sinecaudum]|uniref:ATP phosphoribosyltransferase n=1 Tax=Eremothecium sinecaudum TaxID=45286 RepID=A0A0X8HRA2_9SACH|nr:HCL149Wp [Eremothecium sinecaudum]AMD20002.1 HCL149Wp [Eremothecium sinecaudum]